MKKLIIGVLCFAALMGLSALPAFAATKTVTWSLPTDWESSADFGYPSDPVGAPALKFIPVSIKVAEGSVYSNCTVEATWVATDDPRPEVINEPHIVGEAPILSPEDPQYWNAAYFPATPENVGGIQTCAGEAAIMAWVTPYRWNGRTQKLEKATALKLTFTYDAPRAKLKLTTSSANDKTGVMYIISPPNFKTLWQAYVDYRQTTHPDVEFHIIDTVSEIYNVSPYSGGRDDAQRIHKFLEAKYAIAKAAGQKMYAILGAGCAKGNESYNRDTMIPLRMTVAYSRSYFPSDLYYSCMDKRDNKGEVWDYDNDGYFLGTSKSNSDPEWKIDWQPDIVALRFPVRTTVYLQNVSGSASRSYTAQEQINGLVNKLKIYEGASGASRTFGGYFRYSVSYHKLFEDVSRGSTDDKVAGEHTFFDGIENMWTANHTAVFEDAERNVRHIHRDYETAYRPLAGTVNNTQVYNNDLEINTHNSHGQEQTAAPFQAYDFFSNGRIQFFMNYGNSCLTGKIDTGDVDGHGNLSFAEACILNPNGGAIVTLNNTREGYGAIPGYRELMSLAMQIGMIKGFYSLGDGSVYEAFIKGHQYSKNSVGFSGAGGCMAACYVEANTMGDPLAKLKSIESSATIGSAINGFFAKTGNLNADTSVNGTSGVVDLNVNTAGNTITLGGGSQFKATGKLTVNGGGTLKWNAPGGVGRNGVAFTTRGRLVCEGNAPRYFGARFSGLDEILVTGYNTTLDFDKTGATRDVTSLKFINPDPSNFGNKPNYIRSREGGIFKADMSIPVENSTLVLQTTNIGGSGNASNTTTPIFTLTNAVLKIAENPHWGNEMINRPIWMNGATINVAYQSFGFGAKVSGSNGMTLRVLDKTTNTISGNYDAEINGAFRVEVASNAVLKINVPLTKSSYAGSLVKSGDGQLELRAANTFTGGVTLQGGKTIFGKEALTSSACGTVTVESGATLQIESLPLASVTKLTVKAGGKLILPGDKSTASYQLVDPSVGSLDFADGALVYNEHNLTTPLKGSATSDGYYMDTSSFLHWKDQDGTWSTDSAGSKWMKGGTEEVSYANGNSVQFPDHGAKTHGIAVSGTVQPGYITFNNSATAYNFTGSGSKISIENLYTVGDTAFEPEVSAGSKAVVTSGKTTFKNLTTASASISPKGELQVTGTFTPATYIKAVKVEVTAYQGEYNFILGANRYRGFQFNGIQFYLGGKLMAIPAGTTISASGSFNSSTASANATVQGVSDTGVLIGYTGTQGVAQILDGNASTGWGGNDPGSSSLITAKPSCTVIINFGSPIRMFDSYKIAGGNIAARSPYTWKVTVTENSSSAATQVHSTTASPGANSWWTSPTITYSGASSASVNVSNGGTLFLNGTYNAPITVGADSTLAVTNAAKLTANKGFTLKGNVTLDVSEAQKSTWFEVLHGANLAADTLSKFALNSDEAAAKITGGNLYVATKDVKKGPYTRTMTGDTWDWNTTDWSGAGTPFGITWADAITRMSDNTIVTINNSSTGTLNCAVICNTIFFTNETDTVQTVRVNGTGAVSCNTLDFSGLKGEITWAPDLGGANVVAGTNRVILLKGVGNTVSVASNGYVSTVGTFTSYDIQPETRMHFANTGRAVNMSQLPSQGILSFDGMTIQSGVQGAFQKQNVTFLVEDNQSLKLSDTTGFNGRCLASFDVRGGNVTIEPGGAWWFGQNGVTKYNQTGGTFTCNASAGTSVLFGYQGESSFLFDINVAGGTFEIPNALANIYNPANINIGTNGVFRAKGITVRDGVNGTVNINEQGTLEVGSSGLAAARVAYNLFGGTLAAFESVSVGAPIELGSVGTLAAKTGTTLTYNGTIKAENATLKFGREGYAGTVKLAEIPAGVTNYQVVAGTWDMGELRPTNDIPVSVLTGKIAAQLTDEELRQAASDAGFKLIKTTLSEGPLDEGHVAVVTRSGTAVTAMGRVQGGYIYLSINYVYPLYGEVKVEGEGEQRWADIAWHDSIGMPFNGDWSKVTGAVLSNELNAVSLTVTNALAQKLTIVNSGALVVSNNATIARIDTYNAGRLTIAGLGSVGTLQDGSSTGETTVDVAVSTQLTAGLDTVVRKTGTGTLSVVADHKVTFNTNLNWTATTSYASGAKVRFLGDRTASAPIITTAGVITSYESGAITSGKAVWPVYAADEGDNWRVNSDGNTGITAPIKVVGGILTYGSTTASPNVLYFGGAQPSSGVSHSVITVKGGRFIVDAHGHTASGNANGLLLGMTANTTAAPAINVSGGSFEIVDSSINFWESSSLTVSGTGFVKAKGIFKGDANQQRTGTINLNGGELSVGNLNILKASGNDNNDTLVLNLAGGKLSAWENCTVKSGSLTVNSSGTSRLGAAADTTLTVEPTIAGSGTILCEPVGTGKVVLKGGVNSNVALGGTFTLYLTDEQKGAAISANLFKPADGFDASKVTLVDSTGTKVDGELFVYGGYVTYVPATGFKMPIVGELYTNSLTSTTYWHDSSDTPRTYPAGSLASATEIILNVHSNVTFGCNYTATYPSFRIRGPGQLTLLKNPSVHTLTQCYIETDVISTDGAVTFTAADIAENASLTVLVGKAPGSISGKGTLVSDGATLPTSTGLTDATKWQGTVKLTGTLNANLNLSTVGNASSAVEFSGALTDSDQGYFYVPTVINSAFVLTSTIKIQNGNSQSIQVNFAGPFSGTGTFMTVNNSKPWNKDIFQVTGDASKFAGAITLNGTYHDFAFGTQTYGTGGTIFVGNDKGATIVDGKQWTAPTEIKVQNGGTLNIAARTGETYASPSKVTVVSGGYLNLLQTSEDQLVWRITSNATFTLPAGCLKVNGKVMASDQYSVSGGIITLKCCTLTWNGGATGGTWDTTASTWLNGSSSAVAWFDGFKPGNTAKFNGDTSLTLGEVVSPDVLDIGPNNTSQTYAGFIPQNEANKVTVATNMKLTDVSSFGAYMSGKNVSTKGDATPRLGPVSASEVTVQFQRVDDGWIKCVIVVFKQSGDDIVAYATSARYISATGHQIGEDLSNANLGTVVTSDTDAGYGVKNIKLSVHSVGTLVVGGAEKFGKAFTVTNGVLTVATGALAQDVTIAAGAKLNIITTDVTNEYVVTSGKVVNGDYANILVNGEAIDSASWTLDLEHGKLVRVVQPGVPPFSYTISADSPSPVLWTNQQWLASNLFYVLPEEWTTGTVSEVKLTVDGNVTNTLVANANMTITLFKIANSGYLTVTNGLVGGDTLGAPFTLNVGTLDDSASSGKTVLDFPLNATAVKAGSDTVLTTTGTGTVTIGAGMQATLYGDAALSRAANTFSFTEGTGSYRTGALKFGADGGQGLTVLPSGYVNLFKTTGKFVVDRPLSVNGELAFGNADNTLQYSTLDVGPNARLSVTKLHTANGKNHFQGSQNGGVVEVTSTDEGDGERQNAVLFGHWNGASTYNLNYGEMLVAGGIMLGWDSTDGDGTVLNIGAANETRTALVRAASIRGCTSGNANKKAMLKVYPNGVLEVKNGVLMAHANSSAKQFVMAGGTLRTTANAEVKLAHAEGVQLAEGTGSTFAATNGTTLTVSAKLSGAGAFFAGEEGYAGTVKLTAQNTFTGNVGVRAGTLDIGGETLRGEVLVAEGATLAITRDGDWGEFTITSGGALNILGDVSLNGTVLERNGWTVKDGKLVVYKPDGTFYWIGSVNTEWNTRDANWKDGELSVAWEDGHYEGNSAAFTNSATITMSETVRPRAITVDNGQTLTISGPTHFARAFDLTGALKLAPTSETLYDFEATGSGAITYAGGTITSLWRGTIPDGGLTIASGALSVTNGYFGSEFNVGTANVFGTTDATLVFDLGADGTQVIKGTTDAANRHYTIKVASGTLNFRNDDGGGNTAFRGRTVAADGTNAVINLATGDATGYSNGGTVIALSNGGTLRVAKRDTMKTPILFNGGTLELAAGCSGTSGRGLDLYGNNNWAVTADSCVTYASETSDNDRKIALRNGDFTIAVEKDVTLTVEAVLAFNNNYGGTEGKLIKTGAGTLELSADNTYCKGTRIENGTLALDDGASAGTGAIEMSGGMLEFQLGTMTNDIHTTGGIINLVGELPTGEDEVAITTGAMTGEPQVWVNGELIPSSEWMVVGNKLKKVQHIAVSYGEPVTLEAGYEDKPVMFDVKDLAGGTVVINADRTLGSMAISGEGSLTLKFADEGKLTLVSGFVDPSVIIDATGLARNTLAKRSACGAPYSYWLIRGETSAAERTVELPRMPSGYAVAAQTVADFGLRLIVTAPDDARFGVISVNLRSGNALSVAGDHGLYPDDLANWGDLQTTAGKSVTVSNAVFTLGAEASGYYISNYTDEIYRQYLDDNGGVKRTVSIRNVPFDQYRIIVYFSTDNANAQFQPMSVNDGTTEVWYAGETQGETNANHTVIGKNATWGHSGPNFGMNPIAEGVNMLVTDVYTGDVTLGFTRVGGPRATPCAIQVVKVGEMVIGEITDYTAEIPSGTTSIDFSDIEWNEGDFVDGTNHTVTITAPAGCTIVIDEDLTLYNFKVIAGEGVTVKIAEEKTVSLAQGFLGEGYAIYGDFNSCLSAFATGGTTGWTDAHAVTFNYGTVNPNGQDLRFTGAIDAESYVTVYDGNAKPGCVTFGNNVSGIAGLAVNQGTVLLATTTQVTLGALSTYGEGYKRLVMAAKTDEAAIKVPYEWESVELAGVTLDIDTFTEQPIPEDVVQYKLITASSISTNGVTLGSSFKGNWELEVVQDGDLKTLIAKKTKKGFYFIITKNEQTQKTVVAHATDSKRALDIDRAWVVENTTITSDQSQDDAKVTAAINGTGANGAKVWESYVLGLEPTKEASKPVIAPVQSAAADKIAFQIDNISVNPRAGANNVKYKVWSGANPGDKTTASQVARYTDPIAVDLPTSGVRYYHIEVLID